jgi:ribosomal protein S18 acetylase RimI-like enzyme
MKINRCYDIDQVLFEQIMHIWVETGLASPARADDLSTIQGSIRHGACVLIATESSELIGTAWLTHDFRRLYIHHMGVMAAYQNQGIGRTLLSEALLIAKELGYQAKLEVHKDNPAAMHLYESMGFKPLQGYYSMIKRDL